MGTQGAGVWKAKRAIGLALVMAAIGAGVSACADESNPFGPAVDVALPGEALETVSDIDGATRTSVAGVSILVPAGVQATETQATDTVTQLVLTEPSASRALAIVTVTTPAVGTVDDKAIEVLAAASRAELEASGIFTATSQEVATYPGLGRAVVLRGSLAPQEGSKDVLLITTRTDDGTRAVGVSAEAPAGQLLGSLADQVVRSLLAD